MSGPDRRANAGGPGLETTWSVVPMAILACMIAVVCPQWCRLPDGHPADLIDLDGSRLYLHSATVNPDAGGRHLSVRQAVIVRPDGSVERDEPRVVVDEVETYRLAEVRALVAGLAHAATVIDGDAR